MGTPIYNPAIPFSGPIPGGINAGRMIRIQGTPTAVSNRFAINLQCGPNLPPREDIALHMDFRFTRSPPAVARNSLANGQWGHEENAGHLPVARGQPFEVLVLVEHSSFKVAVNGQHFTEFHHRLPFQRVTYVAVDGEVQISAITFEGTIGGAHVPDIGFANYAPPMPGAVNVMPMPLPAHPTVVHGVAPVPVVYPVGAVHHAGHHHPQHHHAYPSHGHGYPSHGHSAAIPIVGGMAVGAAGAYALHGHSPKSAKKQKKAMKKAMKHHKHAHQGMHGYHHHHHGKSSSSSSSSSSEEE